MKQHLRPSRIPIPFTRDEINKMINRAKSTKERLLLQLLHNSDLSELEVANLLKEDLILRFNKGIVRKGKYIKYRKFYFSKSLTVQL